MPSAKRSSSQTQSPKTPGIVLRHTLQGHTGPIGRLAWSPDGSMIASPSDDGTICVWDYDSGTLHRRLGDSRKSYYSLSWAPDGRTLVTAADRQLQLWDFEDERIIRRLQLSSGHTLHTVAWSPTGNVIACYSRNSLLLLDSRTLLKRQAFAGILLKSAFPVLSWSPNGEVLASATASEIKLFNRLDPEWSQLLVGSDGRNYGLAWSPHDDGYLIAAGGQDRVIYVWDSSGRGRLRRLDLK